MDDYGIYVREGAGGSSASASAMKSEAGYTTTARTGRCHVSRPLRMYSWRLLPEPN